MDIYVTKGDYGMDKDVKWYKKWWIWAIAAIVLFVIVSLIVNKKDDETFNDNEQAAEIESVKIEGEGGGTDEINTGNELTEAEKSNTLPEVNVSDYIGQEALIVYHDLVGQGYEIELDYANKDNEKLYQANMNQIERIKSLDPNNVEDRQSVDAYSVYNVVQLGDHLTIIVN